MPPKSSSPSESKRKFQGKELVFAKMTGFKPWPAFIVPTDLIPKNVLKSKKKKDTSEYCVIFIPEGNYGWIVEKNIQSLTPKVLEQEVAKISPEILKQENLKVWAKTPGIKESIAAARGLTFERFMKFTAEKFDEDEEEEEEEEEEEQGEDDEEQQEETLPQKKPKKGRSAIKDEENDADAEDDEDDEEEDQQVSKRRPNKATLSKNGKSTSSNSTTATTTRRLKRELSDDSTISTSSKKKKLANGDSPITKPKNESPKPVTEEEKQHQLWLCRIKLQRTLIQRNQPTTPKDTSKLTPLTADELSIARLILYRLYDFPINVDLLRKTKIHKVLKCIIKDESLKYPDSFKLHERCEEVLAKWDSEIQTLKLEKSARELNNISSSGSTSGNGDHLKDSTDNATATAITGNNDNEEEEDVGKFGDDKFKLKINQVIASQPDDSEISGLDHSITDKKEGEEEEEESNEEALISQENSSIGV